MEDWSVEMKDIRPPSTTPILHHSRCEIFPAFWQASITLICSKHRIFLLTVSGALFLEQSKYDERYVKACPKWAGIQGGWIRLTFSGTVLILCLSCRSNFVNSNWSVRVPKSFLPELGVSNFMETGKEVFRMANASRAAKCCSMEKKKLMAELEKCNFCSDNYEDFHDCYREAARKSGRRSRACLVS